MDTTYVNRENTNIRVIEKANEAKQAHGMGRKKKSKPIKLFSKAHQEGKIKRLIKTINAAPFDPIRYTTFNNDYNIQHRD